MTHCYAHLLPAAAAAALALTLTACGPDEGDIGETEEGSLALGRVEVEEAVERGVVFGGRVLVLEGFSGRVDLDGADVEMARLTFVKQGRGEDAEAARAVLGGTAVEERGTEEEYVYAIATEEGERTSVAVEGRVPHATRARIELESGPVRLSGVRGPLSVRTTGPVAAAGVAGDVDITTRTGDLRLGLRRLPPEAESVLETNNGDITVVLPAGASLRVEAETGAGEIRVEGLSFTDRRLDPDGVGATFQGQLGDGNALLRLRTQNGDVVLRQGTLYTLPPEDVSEDATSPTDDGAGRSAWPTAPPPAPPDTAAPDTAATMPPDSVGVLDTMRVLDAI